MSDSVIDYYMRMHNIRVVVSELTENTTFFKGMTNDEVDVFTIKSQFDTGAADAAQKRQLLGIKQALMDTTSGGYFLKDIISGDAFVEGIPRNADSIFEILYEPNIRTLNDPRMPVINKDYDINAYKKVYQEKNTLMSTRDVVTPIETEFQQDTALQTEEENEEGEIIRKDKLDKDGNKIFGRYAVPAQKLAKVIINRSPKNPDRFEAPSLGAVIMKGSKYNIANRNADLINLFFNAVTPLEMSRCIPYINVKIITPENASIGGELNQVAFLRYLKPGGKQTFEYDDNIGVGSTQPAGFDPIDKVLGKVTVSGMELFTSPQTLSNADIRRTDITSQGSTISGDKILEPIAPFLTLESLKTDISSAGQQLLQSKVASMTLTLHDRSRLKDIAPLIAPKQFGMTKMLIEYGWSHPDGQRESNNPIGKFLNSLRDVGIFTVKSSNMTLGQDNTVKIDVALACMGGSADLKSVPISCYDSVPLNILRTQIKKAVDYLVKEQLRITPEKEKAQKLPEIRKTMNVQQAAILAPTSLIPFEVFTKIVQQAGLASEGEPASKAQLAETFKTLLATMTNANDRTQDDDQLFVSSQTSANEKNSVQQIFGKLYGCILFPNFGIEGSDDPTLAEGVFSDTLFRTPDPFVFRNRFKDLDEYKNTKNMPFITRNYVSLGKVLMSFIGQSLALSTRYDEVQMFFYPLNDQAGQARSQTTASFPIDKEVLKDLLDEAITEGQRTTLSTTQFFNLIERKIIQDSQNFAYGLKSELESIDKIKKNHTKDVQSLIKEFQQLEKSGEFTMQSMPDETTQDEASSSEGVVSEAAKKRAKAEYKAKIKEIQNQNEEKIKQVKQEIDNKLKKIYNDDGGPTVESKFAIPNLSMQIEVLPALRPTGTLFNEALADLTDLYADIGKKQIVRIHIYDEKANVDPRAAMYQRLLESDGFIVTAGKGGAEPGDNPSSGDVKGVDRRIAKRKTKQRKDKETGQVIETKYYTPQMSAAAIKEVIKEFHPNVTLGTNNAVVTSVSVSSTTSGNVQNTLLVTAIGGKKAGIDGITALTDEEELLVIPSTLTLTCLGLPVIQRGNQIYVDMGTGTTLDNIYAVTNVSHTIQAGNFTTTLSLIYTGQGTVESLKSKVRAAIDLKESLGLD